MNIILMLIRVLRQEGKSFLSWLTELSDEALAERRTN